MDFYIERDMRLIIKSEDTPHYRSHGFGALMNKALRLCWLHFEKYGNWNIQFQDYQLEDLFITPQFLNNSESYTKDLIWDGDGPKDIEKNRLAYKNCFVLKRWLFNNLASAHKIGIHARGTDKKTECDLVTIEQIKAAVDKLPMMPIFLATDDQRYVDGLSAIYGNRIECLNFKRSTKPVHHLTGNQRLEINKEAFTDAWMLSKSKVFLACNSNLSELAMAMRHPDLPVIQIHNP